MSQILFVVTQVNSILAFMPYARFHGLEFLVVASVQEAFSLIASQKNISVIMADTLLTDGQGADLLVAKQMTTGNSRQFFLLADHCDALDEQKFLALGVDRVLINPLNVSTLENILQQKKPPSVKQDERKQPGKYGLMGDSSVMQQLYRVIERVAKTDVSVFICGDSGSGKELVANAIYKNSARALKPYLAINCGAIGKELIGSALFGHEKGSFTGAVQAHKGYFEQMSGGTLFLDEITETSSDLQVSLLRVLEAQQVIPVGGQRQIHVDVRIVASTNRDPATAIKQGFLREDLYHRLSVFQIKVPCLREHASDIPLLITYFLNTYNDHYQKHKGITDAAVQHLLTLNYPGNIRQLKNILHRAYILADAVIGSEHIDSY